MLNDILDILAIAFFIVGMYLSFRTLREFFIKVSDIRRLRIEIADFDVAWAKEKSRGICEFRKPSKPKPPLEPPPDPGGRYDIQYN